MSTKLAPLPLATILLLVAAPAAHAGVDSAPLWQPPEGTTPPKTQATTTTPPPARKHRAAPAKRGPAGTNKPTEALEAEVFGPETTTPTVQRKPADDGADQDDASPRTRATGNVPAVVAPHLIAFDLGTSVMSRTFHFDAPLQGDAGAPRAGIAAELEAFPLLSLENRWLARLGIGASFDTEIGNAGIGQPDNGTLIYPFTEMRWGIDVRYAIPLAERFLLVPLFGYGHIGYDLERRGQPAPSACINASTQVCLPDVQVSHMTLGLDARVALTQKVGAALQLAYLPGFGLGSGTGQLGSESDATVQGFASTIAASWQLLDWLALRASVPVIHNSYSFSRRPLAYTSASETYYGVVVGATVFAR
jgi:hypothetical protein